MRIQNNQTSPAPLPLHWFLDIRVDSTAKAFAIWENANEALIRFFLKWYRKVREYSIRFKHRNNKTILRNGVSDYNEAGRMVAVERAFSRSRSLEERALIEASRQGRLHHLVKFPSLLSSYFVRKRRERILRNFFVALVFKKRATRKPGVHDKSILTVKESEKKDSPHKLCWVIERQSVLQMYKIFTRHKRNELEYMRIELTMQNVLYIVWLINPAILGSLLAIFISCDILIPWIVHRLRRFKERLQSLAMKNRSNILGSLK